jgi:hypothetical protein
MTSLRFLGLSTIICTLAGFADSARAQAVSDTRPAGTAAPRDTTRGEGIEVLYATKKSGLDEPLRQVVRDSVKFAALWRQAHARERGGIPPVPRIDFTKDEVVVVAMGFQGGPGSLVAVRKIEQRAATLEIFVELSMWGRGCIGAAVVEYPAVMVRHRLSMGLTSIFNEHLTVTSC